MKNIFVLYLAVFLTINSFSVADISGQPVSSSFNPNFIHDIYMFDANNVIAVGSGGTVLKTSNSGSNWVTSILNPAYELGRIQFLNNNTGWMLSNPNFGHIMKTTDGGQNWNDFDQITGPFYFSNEDDGWAAYTDGTAIRIYHTTNGGINWTTQFNLPDNYYPNTVYMGDDLTGYVLCFNNGPNSKLIKTTNGGADWIVQPLINYSLYTCEFINSNTGWAAGVTGTILKTSNGGDEWILQSSGTIEYLRSVSFLNENSGWICGESIILKTSNGGVNWDKQFSLPTMNFFSINSYDENNIWSAGNLNLELGGIIYKTLNGGNNWTRVYDNTVSINSVSNTVPEKFSLSQNYPNPFNPVTNLEFGIADLGFVTLKIYNGLGRELQTLVNGNFAPGNYKVDFDGSNFASGVYFYKLEAGSFVETKRMMLLK